MPVDIFSMFLVQVPPARSEQEIAEEEELQLALALSRSEAESKEKEVLTELCYCQNASTDVPFQAVQLIIKSLKTVPS